MKMEVDGMLDWKTMLLYEPVVVHFNVCQSDAYKRLALAKVVLQRS